MTTAIEAAAQGIASADAGANPLWREAAITTFKIKALTMPRFTTDDVWEHLERRYPGLNTHDHRAMGPVCTAMEAEGVIKPVILTDTVSGISVELTVKSRLVVGHARRVRVYEAA